jgi:hypothetical protein
MTTTTSEVPSALTPLRLAFHLAARLHAVRRRAGGHDWGEEAAITALFDWLDAVGSQLAVAVRSAKSRCPQDIVRSLVGGAREYHEHWGSLDVRGILVRSVALFALATIASETSTEPTTDLALFPLELLAELSDPAVLEPNWLLLAPLVAARLTDKSNEPYAYVRTIAGDILAWASVHNRLEELCTAVAQVRRAFDDRELALHASIITQTACSPHLHS